jgi:hypothetical protein
LKVQDGVIGLDSSVSGQGPIEGSCEDGERLAASQEGLSSMELASYYESTAIFKFYFRNIYCIF